MGLNILPVYRLSEGAENLNNNYDTFSKCRTIFRKNGIVLIFSEGLCINEWKLRPLKKGTARLAFSSWEEGIPLRVIPAGINYSSFDAHGKVIHLHFGTPIQWSDFGESPLTGQSLLDFNTLLKNQLNQLVYDIDEEDKATIHITFHGEHPKKNNIVLNALGWLGMLIHAPLYFPLKRFFYPRYKKTAFYDSIMIGSLFLLYPFYFTSFSILFGWMWGFWFALIPLVMMPFLAWCRVQGKFI